MERLHSLLFKSLVTQYPLNIEHCEEVEAILVVTLVESWTIRVEFSLQNRWSLALVPLENPKEYTLLTERMFTLQQIY